MLLYSNTSNCAINLYISNQSHKYGYAVRSDRVVCMSRWYYFRALCYVPIMISVCCMYVQCKRRRRMYTIYYYYIIIIFIIFYIIVVVVCSLLLIHFIIVIILILITSRMYAAAGQRALHTVLTMHFELQLWFEMDSSKVWLYCRRH